MADLTMEVMYTTEEGGKWIPQEVPYSKKDCIDFLEKTFSAANPKKPSAFINISRDDVVTVNVVAVLFPDKTVWDSILRYKMPDKTISTWKHSPLEVKEIIAREYRNTGPRVIQNNN